MSRTGLNIENIDNIEKYIVETYKKKTYVEISKDLGVTEVLVYRVAKILGLKKGKPNKGNPTKLTKEIEEFLKENARDMTLEELSKALKISESAIFDYLKMLGLERKRLRPTNGHPNEKKQ